ncbi:uncharacterized protein N7483_008022 [Penicillium malachiteum]|uniref:uncharacterized protein n=1 Tax=Penicillium malachiteum TaxID=1324776 RepID=UPI002547AB70|nr:uncharacterized protein N7483_008022 [Penicillium malachiteum]KAJ5726665.1 hypothetical protein N7483_008022 [Penicillium malachiteum]
MSTKERLLRLTSAHYRKDGCSERDCHFFGTIAHAKEVATLHSSKGLVLYHQVFSTKDTRDGLERFKSELGAEWSIEDHDFTVELYVRDLETLRAIAYDPIRQTFPEKEAPYLSERHVVASLAWVEVFVQEGRVVGLGEDGVSAYKPSFEEIVAPEGPPKQDAEIGLELKFISNLPCALSTCPMLENPTTATWSGLTFVDLDSGFSSSCALSNASPTADPYLQSGNAANTWQYRFNEEWAMLSAEQQSPPDDGMMRPCAGIPRPKSQETQNLRLSTIRGLSDLNVEMFTLSSTIPKPPACISQPHSWKEKDFAIDKTFQLSQRLIEVLDKLYPGNLGSNGCTIKPSREDELPVFAPNDSPFDQSSFLLILSCYQRLIETYHDIFGNMQACLDRSTITAREDYVQMPDMKVGSFSVPDSSALQITMILQLSRHLLRRMGTIIKSLKTNYNGGGTDDLMSLTFRAVNNREDELIETINNLRNSLLSLDIL